MKTNHILPTLVLLLFAFTARAQQGINYKAIEKDGQGAAIVNIGEGTVVSGVFDDLDSGATPHFLKTEIDLGTSEFKTVPYALHALNSSVGVSELNDLSDVKTGGGSFFIGQDAGNNDVMNNCKR